jgi:hypothetical protein
LNRIAAITPGIQPQMVSRSTSRMAPQPLSITASGGKMIQIMARRIPMGFEMNGEILSLKIILFFLI